MLFHINFKKGERMMLEFLLRLLLPLVHRRWLRWRAHRANEALRRFLEPWTLETLPHMLLMEHAQYLCHRQRLNDMIAHTRASLLLQNNNEQLWLQYWCLTYELRRLNAHAHIVADRAAYLRELNRLLADRLTALQRSLP